MLSWFLADCLSSGQAQDRQSSKSCVPEIISAEPPSRPGMVIASPPGTWLDQDRSEGAERIRGGALSCACCGGSGSSRPSLNPPEAPPEQSPSGGAARPTNAGGEVQQMSQVGLPAPSSQPARVDQARSMEPSQPLAASSEVEAGRSRTKSLNPPAPSHPKPRDRYTTLPSKLPTNQQTSASSGIVSPTFDTHSSRNPVIPPSVSTPAASRRAPGEAAPKATFAGN